MKNKLILLIAFLYSNFFMACPACKKRQPEGLENITHGSGPEGTIDYMIIWVSIIIVTVTFILSVKYLINPNEKNINHIKNSIL